jgi:hypothetical protein
VKKAWVLAAALACSKAPSAQDCDAMLDRYLDMTEDDDPALTGMSGEPRAGVRAARISERRASLAYLTAEKRCAAEVTPKEHACAMKAPSANEWEACFEYH